MAAGDIFLNRTQDSAPSTAPDALALLRRHERLIVVILLTGLFALVCGEVARGRFWAEEGKDFYQPFQNLNPLQELFFLYHGQLQLWTNISVAASEFAGLERAPLVTTWLAGAVIVGISAGIYILRDRLGLNRFTAAILIGFYWFTPQAAELWATSTNTQWHAGFLAALVLLAPADGQRVWLRRVLLAACALEGLPACILAPAFLLAAGIERNRQRLIESAILFAAGALQAGLIVSLGDTDQRAFGFDALQFVKTFIAQAIWSPVLGGDFLNDALRGRLNSETVAIFTYAGLLLFIAPLLIGRPRPGIAVLLAASISVAAISYFGMRGGDAETIFSGTIGGRYFFAPALLNVAAWLWAVGSRLPPSGRAATISRAVLAALAVPLFWLHATTSPWRNVFFHGPDWSAEVRDLKDKGDRHLAIWPDGWFIDLPAGGQK